MWMTGTIGKSVLISGVSASLLATILGLLQLQEIFLVSIALKCFLNVCNNLMHVAQLHSISTLQTTMTSSQ